MGRETAWEEGGGGRRREEGKVDIEIDGAGAGESGGGGAMEETAAMSRYGSEYSDKDGDDAGMMMRIPLLKKRTNQTSQLAIVGANVSPIESLDYEILENELFKQDWRSRRKVEIFQFIFCKWTLALLIGLGTGIVGFCNNLAVENIAGFKLLRISNLTFQGKYYQAFAFLIGSNLILAIFAASLCAYIAPAAAGSGIPEVKAYLNGVDSYSILAPSTLLVKIFGSIFGVAAGFVVGKEGPMVHTGACIASLLGQGGSRKYHLTWKWLRYFKNDRDRRDLITCGAAAGVAAAFRAPVGGVLFALEEAASWSLFVSVSLLSPACVHFYQLLFCAATYQSPERVNGCLQLVHQYAFHKEGKDDNQLEWKKDVVKSKVRGVEMEFDHEKLATILGVPGTNGICEYIKDVWEESKYTKPLEITRRFTNDENIMAARRVKSGELKPFQRFVHFLVMKNVVPRFGKRDTSKLLGSRIHGPLDVREKG
ncbi:hypothetical protein Dimus_012885 [Dionaea muscipula]